jgi:hypothetical protein
LYDGNNHGKQAGGNSASSRVGGSEGEKQTSDGKGTKKKTRSAKPNQIPGKYNHTQNKSKTHDASHCHKFYFPFFFYLG